MMKRILVFLLILAITVSSAAVCFASDGMDVTSEASSDTHEIIKEIILYYGCYGDQAEKKVEELLEKLTEIDSRQGKLWRDIMDYWKYVNTDLEVNVDCLPEGLPEDDSLCIIALGFELNPDGSMQDELLERLKVTLNCANQYPNAYVVCTGGGTAKKNPDVTEAGLMGEWLLANGLDPNRLIIEDQSHTTAENAANSYKILLSEYPQADSIVLISSSYHIPWGSLLFESAFMKTASEQETPEIHVITNCSCPVTNEKYQSSSILRWETGGMLQMIDEFELAMEFYRDYENIQKPELS